MVLDSPVDPEPVVPKPVGEMTDDEYVDFVADQSFPASDPPPYYRGHRKDGR